MVKRVDLFAIWVFVMGMFRCDDRWLLLGMMVGERRSPEIDVNNELFEQKKDVSPTETCIRMLKNIEIIVFYHLTIWVIYCACKKKFDIYYST